MFRPRRVSSWETRAVTAPRFLVQSWRSQTQHSLGPSRDRQRGQPNADPGTGNQMSVVESPDLTPHLQFGLNNLEYVKLPDVQQEKRNRSDVEKDRNMREKFGEHGPGERLTKNSQQTRRDMLQEQQDVDGLPWEIRWRKSLIPTSEEIIQDVRDRFDLYVQDPIEREQEWYLHWKDRSFKIQKDRMIWPQGYTDYLDHYDEFGRRRVLPSDQRWSDTSWKHLADTKYKDRMWLIEGEERKAVHTSLREDKILMEEEEQRQLEMGDVYHGIVSGIVDLDPEQTYQALSGSADPLEVAKTKMKINAYGAGQAIEANKAADPDTLDPISGFPKADMEPLASGITVEQATSIATQANVQYEMLEQQAEMARQGGSDPTIALMKAHHKEAKRHGDQPAIRAVVEANVEKTQRLSQEHQRITTNQKQQAANALEEAVNEIESSLGSASSETLTQPRGSGVSNVQGGDSSEVNASGYISVDPRPSGAQPNIPIELYNAPEGRELHSMPQWYRETLVETDPLIRSYGLTNDPLETKNIQGEFYAPPPLTDEDRITNDTIQSEISAFDEMKMHKLQSLPELVVGYKPLPLYREVAPVEEEEEEDAMVGDETGRESHSSPSPDVSPDSSASPSAESAPAKRKSAAQTKKKSQRLRKERLERLRKTKVQYDPDILLPSLPWETDPIVDPYRGVAKEDSVDFHKANLEATWRAYRETFQQALTEFGNLTQVTSEDKCEKMLFDTMDRFRLGEVGEHPQVAEEQEEVMKLIFEAHTKHFLADFYKFRGNRMTESTTTKAEADEILRRASAKCKLLGPNFMNFIQEMTSLELDSIRKNPMQRYAVMVRDRKYEPIAKPFITWIENELGEFVQTEFQSVEQLETHTDFLVRHVSDARYKCPMRVEGIRDAARDAAVEAFYQWCRGALCHYAAKHFQRMYIEYADTRFRSRAEQLSEDAIEWFSNYGKAGKDIVQIPVPDCDPPYEYDEKDFLDGEHAVFFEISGHLDKAEGIWHSGSSKRWYPMTDETEYMWYNERRGRISLALDISDRCLENVNKKTHPSIHPFPERAFKFLEGAPLTQETAEHLWMRNLADIYFEHSEMMQRNGRYQTGRSHREKCLNLYHLAIRTSRERLPASWIAPLLTEAKYLLRVYEPGQDVQRHLEEVETVVNKLFATPEPAYWIEPFSELPYRVALVHGNLAAFGELITQESAKRVAAPSQEVLLRNMEQRAKGGPHLPELQAYYRAIDEVAQVVFRDKVLRWRAKEREGCDAFHFWTHLYFAFRVNPKTRDEVQKMWDMYEPSYLYIYTQSALASRFRGQRLINDALRRTCQILLPGDRTQQETLLKELQKTREKLAHIIDRRELDRAINALEAHIVDPRKEPYVYGSAMLYKDAVKHERIASNPLLRTAMGAKDYAELRDREQKARQHGSVMDPQQASQASRRPSMGDEGHFSDSPDSRSTKELFTNDA